MVWETPSAKWRCQSVLLSLVGGVAGLVLSLGGVWNAREVHPDIYFLRWCTDRGWLSHELGAQAAAL